MWGELANDATAFNKCTFNGIAFINVVVISLLSAQCFHFSHTRNGAKTHFQWMKEAESCCCYCCMETFFNGLRLSFSSHFFFISLSEVFKEFFFVRRTYLRSHKLHVVDGGKRGKLSSWKNRKALTRQLYFVYSESNYEKLFN